MFPIRDDQPTYSKPVVVITLIILNAMVFLHEMQLDDYSRNYFIMHYGLIADPRRFHVLSLITSQFLHGGFMHIIGNMVFLWAFGRTLESYMGSVKFLIFYLLCGIAAGLTQTYFSLGSNVPMVGASGAIAGVMGAYLVKFPRARIYTFVFIFVFITRIEIPALFFLPYWFLTQLLNVFGTIGYSHLTEGGVAYYAHIGGFLAGIALVNLLGAQNRYVRRRDIYW